MLVCAGWGWGANACVHRADQLKKNRQALIGLSDWVWASSPWLAKCLMHRHTYTQWHSVLRKLTSWSETSSPLFYVIGTNSTDAYEANIFFNFFFIFKTSPDLTWERHLWEYLCRCNLREMRCACVRGREVHSKTNDKSPPWDDSPVRESHANLSWSAHIHSPPKNIYATKLADTQNKKTRRETRFSMTQIFSHYNRCTLRRDMASRGFTRA